MMVATMAGELAQQDRTALLAELFEDHASRLAGALTAAGYPDATDAVQEAFVQAVVHWRKVASYEDPLQWIRHVAVNRARNKRRGRRRQHALAERVAAQPERTTEIGDVNDDLRTAIERLPEQQRLAISLFYFADLSVADVASAMDLSDGAVKYHLHAARAALAQTIGVNNGI